MIAALAVAVVIAFSPNPSHFGQLVTATVQGGAGTPNFSPFAVRAHHGDTYELQCLQSACVPGPGPLTLMVAGQRLTIVPRATPAQVSKPLGSFKRQTAVPPPAYRIRPSLLRALLLALAAVLVAVGVFLGWPLLRRVVPQRVDERTPLQRALDLVRASLRRSGEDRRRALDLLGRTLASDPQAHDALDLAWSKPEPEPERVELLVETVERGA